MKTHINIPVFIPHYGCKNECVFCNQKKITGREQLIFGKVKEQIEAALQTVPAGALIQIAYFGGSFTGIDRNLMLELLKLADFYVRAGFVGGLRCSTRPDYIDMEILSLLKQYHMDTVELGIQSMEDRVLAACQRGHTSEQSRRAMRQLKENGFTVIGQMMVGLPEAELSTEMETAEEICRYCDGARIYPTVVFCGTELANRMKRGLYTPLGREEALARVTAVKKVFLQHGVPVIRVGLQSQDNLYDKNTVLSDYDPAIGEACESRIYGEILERELGAFDKNSLCGKKLVIYTASGTASRVSGIRKANKARLFAVYAFAEIVIREDGALPPYTVRIEVLNR